MLNGPMETPPSFSEISEPLRQTPGDSIPSSALHTLSPVARYTQGSFRLSFVQVLNLPTGKVSVGEARGRLLVLVLVSYRVTAVKAQV